MPDSLTATDRFEKAIESPLWRQPGVAYALAALLLGVDYFTGPEIIVPTYFMLPAMLLAWNRGMRPALVLAIILTVSHIAFLNHWGMPPRGVPGVINAGLRAGGLMLLTAMAARLGAQSRMTRERLLMLEGFLPTCSFCKDIRNQDDEWEQIEAYLARHSTAQFSHGVCPACAEKHYGVKMDSRGKVLPQPNPVGGR